MPAALQALAMKPVGQRAARQILTQQPAVVGRRQTGTCVPSMKTWLTSSSLAMCAQACQLQGSHSTSSVYYGLQPSETSDYFFSLSVSSQVDVYSEMAEYLLGVLP